MRLLTTRLALTALVAGFVSMVGASATAATAPVPCVQTFAGSAKAIAPETTPDTAPAYVWTTTPLTVPASSDVEDIDVTFDIVHPSAKDMLVQLSRLVGGKVTHSARVQPRLTGDTGAEPRPLTFDDEATAAYTAASGSGRYRPSVSLSTFDGLPAGATWRLDVANWHSGTSSRIASWSVRISFSSCDEDADGAEDHTDNCRGIANPDQSDIDRDGTGDACDGDLDGDGVASPADNCPSVVNPTQDNSDTDALGDACDADDDDDRVADELDGCRLVSASTSSGCPSVATRVRVRKKASRLVGTVRADLRPCVDRVAVTLKRKKPGRDGRLVVVTTKSDGRFRTRVPKTAGRYYVVVRKRYATGVAECGRSRSTAVRVRRCRPRPDRRARRTSYACGESVRAPRHRRPTLVGI